MADTHPVFVKSSADEMNAFRAAKQEWSQRLLLPASAQAARALRAAVSPSPAHNVVGVGIGEKIADGKPTGIRALKFLVRLKYPEGQLDVKNRLPKSIDGLPVD